MAGPEKDERPLGKWSKPAIAIALVVSLPFWLSGTWLAWKTLHLPDHAGNVARARVAESAVFSLGFALGLIGSASALACASARRRACGFACAVVAVAFIAVGYLTDWFVESHMLGCHPSLAAFIVPSILLLTTLMMALTLVRCEEKAETPQEPDLKEEQPQPLSRP